MILEDPPFDLQGNDAQFAPDISYGPYEDNVFDICLLDSPDYSAKIGKKKEKSKSIRDVRPV